MPWYDPVLPVAGTAITVPFYQQNIYEPLRDLHQRVGSGSPGASGKFLVSTSGVAGVWRVLDPATDFADGSVPAAKLPDNAIDGDVKLTNGTVTGTDSNGSIPVEGVALDRLKITGTPGAAAGFPIVTRDIGAGVIRPIFAKLKHNEIDSDNTASDGQILHYDLTSGKFQWRSAGVAVPAGLIASFRTAAAIASGWNRCDGGGSPARPNMDGRIPVGAGTTFTVTWNENTAYGASWSHAHTTQNHSHSGSDMSLSGNTAASTDSTNSVQSTGSTSVRPTNHTHGPGAMDISGNTGFGGPDGGGATSTDAWTIPSFAVVWAIKS